MKTLILTLTFLASVSSFAMPFISSEADIEREILAVRTEMERNGAVDEYSLKIYREDLEVLARINSRMETAKGNESSECLEAEIRNIEKEVQAAKAKYGDLDEYSEKILREDLKVIARINARTCLMLK